MLFGQGQTHWVVEYLETRQVRFVGDGRFADQGDIQTTLTQAFEFFNSAQIVLRTMDAGSLDPQNRSGGVADFPGESGGDSRFRPDRIAEDVAALSAVIPAAF